MAASSSFHEFPVIGRAYRADEAHVRTLRGTVGVARHG